MLQKHVKLCFMYVYTYPNPTELQIQHLCVGQGCGEKEYSYVRKPTINIFLYVLDCVLLTSTLTQP